MCLGDLVEDDVVNAVQLGAPLLDVAVLGALQPDGAGHKTVLAVGTRAPHQAERKK